MAFLISAIVIISAVAAFVLIKKQPQAVVEQPITPTASEPVEPTEPEVVVEEVEEVEPVATAEEVEPKKPAVVLQEIKAELKKKKPATKPAKKDK
jgi:hypothetical protein